ncbi:sodium solute symporter [Aureococcus anophagefferens]|uniref:Sodium solute symporter n=1 Tax=Aureococcus anophagefferens TaxID=44056 RepID=A0ABR1GE25_AURAN
MSGRLLQEAQPYTVPEGGAMGILFGVLCLTGLLCVAGIVLDKGSTFRGRSARRRLPARGQSAWYSIALSFFASGMGAWIVYGTTEMGATRPISWWGVIGYSTASAFPRCFYMYIYMVAELTSIGNVYATLVGKSVAGDDSEHFTTKIAICVALFTWAYTALAGLPASILTDKFQGVVITCVVIMLLVATTTLKSNEVSKQEYDDATGWFSKGFEALKLAYLSFFDLLRNLPRFWHYVTLALLTTLAASSLDTLQNGIASVLSRDLLKQKLNTNWSLPSSSASTSPRSSASDRFEVVPLFLVADLVCATAVFPLFLGLWTDDLVVGPLAIPAPTELGAFLGALAGIAAVMVNGEINDVNKAVNPYTGKVYDKRSSPSSSRASADGDDALLPTKDLELDAIQVADDEKKSSDEELMN